MSDMQKTQDEMFTMSQASQRLGVPSVNLRRYCNRGLVPGLQHSVLGRPRQFSARQLDDLKRAHFLTQAGFTVKDIRKYISLAQKQSEATVDERREMILTHKRQVWQKLEDLQATIDFLERQEELLH